MMKKINIGEMFGASSVETFLGMPKCEDVNNLNAKTAILGVPCVTPYQSVGPYCAEAPNAIRQAISHYAANLHHIDFDIQDTLFAQQFVNAVDCGDLPYDENDFSKNRDLLRQTVSHFIDQNCVPILIGGDDSVPIPMFEAFSGHGEFTIVQLDAHIDWREEVDGERWGLSSNMRRASEMPHIKNIIQIGQRGIGSARPSDYQDALEWGVIFHSAFDVYKYGSEPILESVPDDQQIIIAMDLDVMDPSFAPGVIGRAPGGLTYWQVVELLQGLSKQSHIAAFNLVEYMPARDVDQIGALAAARIIANILSAINRQ